MLALLLIVNHVPPSALGSDEARDIPKDPKSFQGAPFECGGYLTIPLPGMCVQSFSLGVSFFEGTPKIVVFLLVSLYSTAHNKRTHTHTPW